MIEFTPPFYLVGQAGKTLDATPRLLADLGICNASLELASLDVAKLTFMIPSFKMTFLPDQEQVVELRDSASPSPRVLFRGRITRTFSLARREYSFSAEDEWKRLSNAPLKGESNDRPYRVFPTQSLQSTLNSLVSLAQADGLSIQPPASWPTFYAVPKMALRAMSYADSIVTVLKYCPDAGAVMDYSTTPARLKFVRRGAAHVIDLDAAGHGVTDARLTPQPWQRALGVTIHYAERTSLTTYNLAMQTAGDVDGEADRQISLMLSGFERTDGGTLDSLNAALAAYNQALTSLSEVAVGIDQIAATAQVAMTWDGVKTLDPKIIEARAQREFTMKAVTASSFSYYSYYYYTLAGGGGKPAPNMTVSTLPLRLRDSAGNLAPAGWYPIRPGSFTNDHLTRAAATKQTFYVNGELTDSILEKNASPTGTHRGLIHLATITGSSTRVLGGYSTISLGGTAGTGNPDERTLFYFYRMNIAVDAINKTPAQVAAAVKASIDGDIIDMANGAAFVAAPPDLALNYFNAQNWTPMTGTIDFMPGASWIPAPGDHVQFSGGGIDPEWGVAEAPIKSISIDLHTGAVKAEAGFPARKTLSTLMDALQVPAEDNYV